MFKKVAFTTYPATYDAERNAQRRTGKERALPAFGRSVLAAVLLGTAPCQSVGATLGDPSSPDHTPAAQHLDGATAQPATRSHSARSHSAIRAVWSQVDAAWNARDAQAFSRLYAEDVSFAFVQRGQSLDGRATILAHFGERFPRYAPDLRHRTRIGAIQAIAPGVFTADGNVEILRVSDTGDEPPAVLKTFAIFAVMARKDEDWSIQALRIYELSSAPEDAG